MALPPGVRRAMRSPTGTARSTDRPGRSGALSLAAQCFGLARDWPSLHCRFTGQGSGRRLVCRGALRPTMTSRTYVVRIEYAAGRAPRVYVESPPLTGRPDQTNIPHTYAAGEARRPCLYFPDDGDWGPDRLISTTIVPWLLEWLVFYELWHATGEWLGGGVEHNAATKAVGTGETAVALTPAVACVDAAPEVDAVGVRDGGEATEQSDLLLYPQPESNDD